MFRGGLTREAAQDVTGASLRTLSNLLSTVAAAARSRHRPVASMHELLRQYAEGRLAATLNAHDASYRHAA